MTEIWFVLGVGIVFLSSRSILPQGLHSLLSSLCQGIYIFLDALYKSKKHHRLVVNTPTPYMAGRRFKSKDWLPDEVVCDFLHSLQANCVGPLPLSSVSFPVYY
jgi:hypothetical protein